MHPWKHFCTITRHRWKVRSHCFRVGLYWRGLTHDPSKYSPTEFWTGAKYYQGSSSKRTPVMVLRMSSRVLGQASRSSVRASR